MRDAKLFRNTKFTEEYQPSQVLLREHFRQALLRSFVGEGINVDHWEDTYDGGHERAPEDRSWKEVCEMFEYANDMWSPPDGLWLTENRKLAFEQYMTHVLFGCLPEFLESSDQNDEERYSRYGMDRFDEVEDMMASEADENMDWPETFEENHAPDYWQKIWNRDKDGIKEERMERKAEMYMRDAMMWLTNQPQDRDGEDNEGPAGSAAV